MMIDQLIIGDKASFDDFGASVASRKIGMPKKKTIKETVPFSNVTYDFSAINGELYWEERELEYIFEILADTPEELEEAKIAFSNWIMAVMKEKIYDPFIPDHHFIGTYDDMDFADEETMDKTTATVKFKAYPYKIANMPKTYKLELGSRETANIIVVNDSAHNVVPKITTDRAITLTINSIAYQMAAGTFEDSSCKIPSGVKTITVKNEASLSCNVTISFNEEVF